MGGPSGLLALCERAPARRSMGHIQGNHSYEKAQQKNSGEKKKKLVSAYDLHLL
jgi:hypothetical protein